MSAVARKRSLVWLIYASCLLGASPSLAAQGAAGAASAERSADMLQRMRAMVADTLSIDAKRVTDTARFCQDLGADSLDEVQIIMAFEDAFHVPIPDDAAEHIHTIAQAAAYISAHRPAR